MGPQEKIAKLLRVDKDYAGVAAESLAAASGHDDVLARINSENETAIKERMEMLGITSPSADVLYAALISKLKHDNQKLAAHFNNPLSYSEEGCRTILNFAKELANVGKGYFLKKEKAEEFIRNEPPQNIMKYFGFKDADELLKKTELFEVYSALRFMEPKEWLNGTFFKQLEKVTPDDFEERELAVHVLGDKWRKAAESFVSKKYHNVSHLKELGIIFVIPLNLGVSGEVMRLFTLVLHYNHEIEFYSRLFRRYANKDRENFAQKIISSLRGDVLDTRFSEADRGKKWMIVQRYLAKEDENDWRLFEPHINPEAIHWSKAENDVARLADKFGNPDFKFWNKIDFVGDFFPDASGINVLVSFNLIDSTMSLVMEEKLIKYLYHHQEALWNKIFAEYMGWDNMEKLIVENFDRGYIDITKQ